MSVVSGPELRTHVTLRVVVVLNICPNFGIGIREDVHADVVDRVVTGAPDLNIGTTRVPFLARFESDVLIQGVTLELNL